MRGIINFGRAFINEAKEFGVAGALSNLWADTREAMTGHFSNHLGGSLSGVYLRLPGTGLSMWMEWRDRSAGLAHQRSGTSDHEIFIGRLHLVLSNERRAGGVEA